MIKYMLSFTINLRGHDWGVRHKSVRRDLCPTSKRISQVNSKKQLSTQFNNSVKYRHFTLPPGLCRFSSDFLEGLPPTESFPIRKLSEVSVFYTFYFWCRHLQTSSFRWFDKLSPFYSIMKSISYKNREEAPFLLVRGHFFKMQN